MSIRGRETVAGRTLGGHDRRERSLFGDFNVILIGDPMQLPIVGPAPMSSDRPGTVERPFQGCVSCLGPNAGVELTDVIRQVGDAQAALLHVLIAVAVTRALQKRFDLWWGRTRSHVPDAKKQCSVTQSTFSPLTQKPTTGTGSV